MDEPKLQVEDKDEVDIVNSKMTVVIELERTFDPNRNKNFLSMTMGAATFTDPATEQKVGEILHGVPADLYIRDAETKEDWVLRFAPLFEAYKRAREEFTEEDEPEEDVILKVGEEDPDNNKVGC